jgi:hypothetical protein
MDLWFIVLPIMVVPYLMMLTARAIHRDESIAPETRRWLAAGVVFFFPLIPAYWIRRLAKRDMSRATSGER